MKAQSLSRLLAAAALSIIPGPASSAATIKSHANKANAESALTKEWDSLNSAFQKLDNEFDEAPPIKFLHDYILSGTYNTKDLPKFLQGDVATTTTTSTTAVTKATVTPAVKSTLPVATEPPPLSVTSASHSAVGQVLSNLSTAPTKPVSEAQFITTPEPSTAVIGGLMLGVALAWRRFRRSGA